jgi:hypothetical protein
MKTLFVTIVFVFLFILITKSQDNEKIEILKNDIFRLENEIKMKSDSLNVAKSQLKTFFLSIDFNSELFAVIEISCSINQEHGWGNILTMLYKNDTVSIIDYCDSGYWYVEKNWVRGYINEIYFKKSDSLESYKAQWKLKEAAMEPVRERAKQESIKLRDAQLKATNKQKEETNKQKEEARRSRIIKTYGNEIGQKILERKFWIGMTNKMAKESLGNPDEINRTVGSWGVHEQWVYGNTYLYFENSVLTSYQN